MVGPMLLTKTQRETAIARNNAARERRRQAKDQPAPVDWPEQIKKLKQTLNEVLGEE